MVAPTGKTAMVDWSEPEAKRASPSAVVVPCGCACQPPEPLVGSSTNSTMALRLTASACAVRRPSATELAALDVSASASQRT